MVCLVTCADDPFIPNKLPDAAAAAALEGSGNVIAVRTQRGGHLGWLQVQLHFATVLLGNVRGVHTMVLGWLQI